MSYCSATGVWYGKVRMKLRRRMSSWGRFISLAAVATRRSTTYVASGRPAPRYASTGTVLVNTAVTSQWITGVVYWPARSVAYRIVGTQEAKVDRYAPTFAVVLTRRPRNLPSLSIASSTVVTWSRPCASDMKDSLRSAVHFTGRLICFEAQVTTTSSAYR